MHLRKAFVAGSLAVVLACWVSMRAQQPPPGAPHPPADPSEIASAANAVSQRSAHLTPIFEQVHAADWVAKGAPEAYVQEWASLEEQNRAVQADMTGIARIMDAKQTDANQDVALTEILQALFRVHRFDSDLAELLKPLRRYQNPALGDLMESVAAGDQTGIEKLQQYSLDLAGEKDRQLDLVDKEAQRCRSMLAGQPVARPAAARKTTIGTPK